MENILKKIINKKKQKIKIYKEEHTESKIFENGVPGGVFFFPFRQSCILYPLGTPWYMYPI